MKRTVWIAALGCSLGLPWFAVAQNQPAAGRNYHKELFGPNVLPSAEDSVPTGVTANSSSRVLRADFREDRDVDLSQPMIERVRLTEERRIPGAKARPFPNLTEKAANAQPAVREVEEVDGSLGTRLTEPISIEGAAAPRDAATGFAVQPKATPHQNGVANPETQAITGSTGIDSVAPKTKVAAGVGAPTVSLSWETGSLVNVGQPCDCVLHVQNTSGSPAHNLVVEAHLPETARLVEAKPQPQHAGRFLQWNIAHLPAGAKQAFAVELVPEKRGSVDIAAHVRFTGSTVSKLTVAEPLLKLVVAGPSNVRVGDATAQIVTISNPGSGVAANVQIEATIPAGLEHVRGKRLLMEVGSLNPGESRDVRLGLDAVAGGVKVLSVVARAEGGLEQTTSAEIQVIAPELAATIDGPGLRYLGRDAVFTLNVKNDGMAATDNVRVLYKVPEGYEFLSTDRGARYDATNRLLTWFVGRMLPQSTNEMAITLKATKAGKFTHLVRAASDHGVQTDARKLSRVEGVALLAMEVADIEDPVEVGRETAYEIRVRNEGTAAATDVTISCQLPAGATLIKADGPTESTNEGERVTFEPATSLAPGSSHVWRIQLRGTQAGHQRLRATLSSAEHPTPLAAEEMTRFYAE